MSHLCACGKPVLLSRDGRARKTCGDKECIGKVSGGRPPAAYTEIHWPAITGPIVADFSAHNLVLKPMWSGARITREDLRQSLTGCSAAMVAGMR